VKQNRTVGFNGEMFSSVKRGRGISCVNRGSFFIDLRLGKPQFRSAVFGLETYNLTNG
jgi:hypothetical protein